MDYSSKTYQSKSSQSILIREASPEDANQLLRLKLQYIKNTDTLPLFGYEYPNDEGEEKELIQSYQNQNNSLLLVAENNGVLIGNIDLTGSWRKKIQHTAVLGMGIHTQWQNQGIGTILIQNVLDWAKQNKLLRIIWLEVYTTNMSGIALYRKMGFRESGKIKGFFLEKNKFIDKIIMTTSVY
ncbi:GNAT family N-acetyltransferase [Aquimarina celericrescens]|uniref:GNAT family N-acetyltransferase n=1 Tax=Aquimarina celericrescens TaxID=1964542 RepID=A0ABW5AXK9_9FLAO|nr:GNAT family N-acetyltransferase [Aquimarina celericrescens]